MESIEPQFRKIGGGNLGSRCRSDSLLEGTKAGGHGRPGERELLFHARRSTGAGADVRVSGFAESMYRCPRSPILAGAIGRRARLGWKKSNAGWDQLHHCGHNAKGLFVLSQTD